MANTTLGAAAAVTGISQKIGAACAGEQNMPGAAIKAFTATAGTGTYPVAGLALDLSALFPNKVLAVVCSMLHDPARTTGDLAFPAVYVPASDGNPATGKVHIYTAQSAAAGDSALEIAADTAETITGFVVTGFAIGY